MQKNNNGISLMDYWTVLRRRRFLMAWVFLGTLFAVSSITMFVPERYRSAAFIRVENPGFRGDLLETTVESADIDLRIDRMRERVVRNENLRPLIEEFSLYQEHPPQARPGQMRRDIDTPKVLDTEDPRLQMRGPETIGFEAGFFHESPETAQEVARRVSELFLAENVASRTETVTEALSFLVEQTATLQDELARTERALAEFKQRHAGSLPGDTNSNIQRLDRAERDLDSVEREIRTLQERKNILLADLSQTSASATLYSESGEPILGTEDKLETLRREFLSMSARYSADHPDVIRLRREIELLSDGASPFSTREGLQTELDTAQAELNLMRQRYADDHPDVRRLDRTVQNLTEQLRNTPAISRPPTRAPNNPDYIRLQVQLRGLDTELAALVSDRSDLRQLVDEIESRIGGTPEIEREELALTRDYEIARRDYNEIREKQAEAERAITIESEQRAERFVLQRSAGLPESPAQPSHLTIVIAGILLALSAAIGIGLLREALDTTVRGARDLRTTIETPPIAMIPMIDNRGDTRQRLLRRGALVASLAAVALFSFSAAT